MTIHPTRIRDGEDVIAAHPSLLPDEADRVDTMLNGVQHGAADRG